MKVTIIGMGSGIGLYEQSNHDQGGPSVLIDVDEEPLLFDVGRSSLQNIFKSKYNPVNINYIFLTHLHSDHIIGLPDLVISPWVSYKRNKWRVYGPKKTCQIINSFFGPSGHKPNEPPTKSNEPAVILFDE